MIQTIFFFITTPLSSKILFWYFFMNFDVLKLNFEQVVNELFLYEY